ncbi:NfeD family protein [Aureibacter tunicatorum]|uniref:Membrane-bound serine protease (ClpP class) n=1 Tax=Aureibacter tunicatorum TaxID=866807 RepID=A0AAE3XID3_9BACT|nr:NfeD family protein [Aureibacter tunicatorum]MDR6238281.1 membrane-bound serine protease (ClpP class) [Aureibacter tunicatorum]BDD03314.1 hypothetical protein AUTU_07970 [Aureibacter tunicatorum]
MKISPHFLKALLLLLTLTTSLAATASTDSIEKVFTFKIDGPIDPRMNRRVDLALEHARKDSAQLIIIEMDTYGGAVNDADDIRTKILESEIPIYVFINKDAASAGALISIACDSIYMSPGASIGAATVVTQDGKAAPDKYQSYMRSIMRSTAEAKGRNPQIAEAMVDESIQIDSVTTEGKVLTFSTSEAIKHGFCTAEVNNIEEILKRNHIDNPEVDNFKVTTAEKIIAFFLNPAVSGILIMIILGGIYFELQSPGIGFPILAAGIAAVLYFVPYYLNGLAENWEIACFIVGVILIGLEVFVIPGFGIAGISGIALVVIGLVLTMLNNDFFDFTFTSGEEINKSILVVGISLTGSFIFMLLAGKSLLSSKYFKRISLENEQKSDKGYSVKKEVNDMIGKTGTAYSKLRPSGTIEIEGEIYDAYTRGEFIDKGEQITIISQVANSFLVKKAIDNSL